MDKFPWLITIAMLIVTITITLKERHNNKGRTTKNPRITKTEDFSKSYQRKYLLTKNEWHEYKKLQSLIEPRGFIICPKVRLLDIIEPIKDKDNYMSLMGRIQSKHVDFLICDKNLHIKCILELDDNSHLQKDRKERDNFIDLILTSVGYKVIHTFGITEALLTEINSQVPSQSE